jgi:hypothetical protein
MKTTELVKKDILMSLTVLQLFSSSVLSYSDKEHPAVKISNKKRVFRRKI